MNQMQEFKYLRCMVNNRVVDKVECEKVMNKRRVSGKIKALVNKKGVKLKM